MIEPTLTEEETAFLTKAKEAGYTGDRAIAKKMGMTPKEFNDIKNVISDKVFKAYLGVEATPVAETTEEKTE